MSDLARSKAFAGDAEYDGLRLRLVERREVVGITRDGWKVRHCVTVLDFGKPSRTIADPDAAGRYKGPVEIGFKGYPHGKTVELLMRVCELLAVRPMLCHEIAEAVGCTTTRIQKLFINQPHGFAVVSRGPRGNLWGLA